MICKHCGKEIEEGLTFCIHCGEPQTDDAKRPVPEQKQKSGALAPLLTVLAFAALVAVGLWLFIFKGSQPQEAVKAPTELPAQSEAQEETLPRVVVDEAAYTSMAEDFAQAILEGDLYTISEKTHPRLSAPFVELFSASRFVFESCTLRATETRKIRRSEERAYESGLYEDYHLEATIDDAYEVMIEFEAVYRGKPYQGEMAILVADMDGGRYVVQAALTDMDVAFYEDNYDQGDYYFDTHSEE